jgi:hypothetical protein
MADSAASVGSFIFGVFAMSVVASSVTLDQVRSPPTIAGPRRERVSLSPLESSLAAGVNAPQKPFLCRFVSYRLGRPKKTAC